MNKIKGTKFGWKNCWFVFKTDDFNKVRETISKYLKYSNNVNFAEGVKEGWDGNWSLFKSIEDNIILLSSSGNILFDKIEILSEIFNEVHFYSSHSSSNYLKFSMAKNGQITRNFSVSDDEIIENVGDATKIEIETASLHKQEQLNMYKDNPEMTSYINKRELLSFLGEFEDIIKISEVFSVNTYTLDKKEVENYADIFKEQ